MNIFLGHSVIGKKCKYLISSIFLFCVVIFFFHKKNCCQSVIGKKCKYLISSIFLFVLLFFSFTKKLLSKLFIFWLLLFLWVFYFRFFKRQNYLIFNNIIWYPTTENVSCNILPKRISQKINCLHLSLLLLLSLCLDTM